MKLFGEYLVEKEVITQEALVKALIQQTKNLPSIAEIVFERSLLTHEQILEVFKAQISMKSGFIEAASKLQFWSESLQKQVEERLAQVRMPLGQVIVQMGAANLEAITHGLDEFLSQVNEPAAPVAAPSVSVPPGGGGSDFTPFCDLLTGDLQALLNSAFLVDPATSSLNGAYKEVRNEIHRLKGAARLVSANQLEGLLSGLENMLGILLQKNLDKMPEELKTKVQSTGKNSLSLLWDIKKKLLVAKNESEALSDQAIVGALRDTSAGLEMAQFDLDFLDTVAGGK